MKAMTLRAPGGLHNLAMVQRSVPSAGIGQVLIEVHANSLNYHDYVVAKGQLPVVDGRVLMSDGAGRVVEVGDGVENLKVGDDVFSLFYPRWQSGEADNLVRTVLPGENVDGFAAQFVAVPESWVTRMPAGYSYGDAATLTCAGITAWKAVIDRAGIKPGDWVLTQGTGGVSIFALQFAKIAGARVIATSSSEEKLEKLCKLGADYVINYRESPEWSRIALDMTDGRGVDLVVEIGGAGTLGQSIEATRVSGCISLIGVLAGLSGEVPTYRIFGKQLRVQGIAVGSRDDQLAMVRGIEATGLRPVVDSTYPLEELADAYRHQEAQRHFGKICIRL
jgi:NADPH:quinone reductase-like Zn-dependent oxidoreductase